MTSGNGAEFSGREPDTALPPGEQPVAAELPAGQEEFVSPRSPGAPAGSAAAGPAEDPGGGTGDDTETAAAPAPSRPQDPPGPSRRKAGVAYRPV